MFDLFLTMSVGVLLRLGGAVRKNKLCKENKKLTFKNFHPSWEKKSYRHHITFVCSDKLLSFLKGHFFFFFRQDFSIYICFCFVCLSVRLQVFLPPLPEVQCSNFLYIRNPWGKVRKRSGLRFELFAKKNVVKTPLQKKIFYWFFSFVYSV